MLCEQNLVLPHKFTFTLWHEYQRKAIIILLSHSVMGMRALNLLLFKR